MGQNMGEMGVVEMGAGEMGVIHLTIRIVVWTRMRKNT